MLASLATIGGGFFSCLLAFVIYPYVKYAKLRRLLEPIGGPPVDNLIKGNLSQFPKRSERMDFIVKLSKQYGKSGAIRIIIGPLPVIQIVSPKMAKEVFSSSKHAVKSSMYDSLKPWLGLGLLTANGEKWKVMRRLTTPAFHFEVLHRFLDVMNEQAEVMVHRIDALADKDQSFDIFDFITSCTLDIICETAMGKKVNAQAVSGHTPYVEAVYQMSKSVVSRFENPLYRSDFIYALSPSGRRAKGILKTLHDFTNLVIRERKALLQTQKGNKEAEEKRRPAFLDILIQAQETEGNISDENIREEVDTFMFEGHDTTSASLAWTCQLLGRHPEVQERVYQELVDVMGEEKDLTYDMLNQLKYLDMVLKESLRIYPSVPGLGRVLTEDITIDGVVVPAGTDVFVSIYAIHHNSDYWEDPEKFDPERWTAENSEGRDPYQYVPFSAGARNCVGQKFAQNEEKVLMAKIIKNFKLTSMIESPGKLPELILRPLEGIIVKAQRRT